METYAVVETGGKQYRVTQGEVLTVEKLEGDAGSEIKLDQVLALSDGSNLQVGTPFLEGAVVTAKILDTFRGDKVVSFKKKRRKGYKRKMGHRQDLTKIEVVGLS